MSVLSLAIVCLTIIAVSGMGMRTYITVKRLESNEKVCLQPGEIELQTQSLLTSNNIKAANEIARITVMRAKQNEASNR